MIHSVQVRICNHFRASLKSVTKRVSSTIRLSGLSFLALFWAHCSQPCRKNERRRFLHCVDISYCCWSCKAVGYLIGIQISSCNCTLMYFNVFHMFSWFDSSILWEHRTFSLWNCASNLIQWCWKLKVPPSTHCWWFKNPANQFRLVQ